MIRYLKKVLCFEKNEVWILLLGEKLENAAVTEINELTIIIHFLIDHKPTPPTQSTYEF